MYNMFFFDPALGLSCSSKNLYRTSDSGITWGKVILNLPTEKYSLLGFTFPTTTTGYIRTSSNDTVSFIPFTTDAGLTWDLKLISGSYDIVSLTFRTPDIGLGAFNSDEPYRPYVKSTADSGFIWKYSEEGITFKPSLSVDYSCLSYIDNGQWIYTMWPNESKSLFFLSQNDGSTWQKVFECQI